MFRIAALNESSSEDEGSSDQQIRESTKEAKEAEAYSLYNKALDYLRHGDTEESEDLLRELIDHDFLQEAWETLEEKGSEAIHPGLQLLYSIQKNLAAMATQRQDYRAAMESYLEAVKIDNSEVSVWFKMGVTALKMEDFQLAKVVLEEGLECNPKHWPCLDTLIPILYSLDNYLECLQYVSKAFELDPGYEKGHAFRNQIYKEQPSLKWDTEDFFKYCSPEICSVQLCQEDAKEYIDKALQMRQRRQELSKPPEMERLEFPAKLRSYRWKCVGELLIELYDRASTSTPPISMGLRVTVPDYTDVPSKEDEGGEDSCPADVDIADANTADIADADSQQKTESILDPVTGEIKSVNDTDSSPTEATIDPVTGLIGSDATKKTDKSETESNSVPGLSKTGATKELDTKLTKEIEKPDAMDVDEVKDSTMISKSESATETTTKASEDVDDKQPGTEPESAKAKDDIPFSSYKGKDPEDVSQMDIDAAKSADSDVDMAQAANSAEENDSLLEAVNVAHSLIDSLSPGKATGFVTEVRKPGTNTIPKFSIDEQADSSANKDNEKQEPLSDMPAMKKCSSYGFTVSGILSPECKSTDNSLFKPQTDQGNIEPIEQDELKISGILVDDNKKDKEKDEISGVAAKLPGVMPGSLASTPDIRTPGNLPANSDVQTAGTITSSNGHVPVSTVVPKVVITDISSPDLFMSQAVTTSSMSASSATSPFMISNLTATTSSQPAQKSTTQSTSLVQETSLAGNEAGIQNQSASQSTPLVQGTQTGNESEILNQSTSLSISSATLTSTSTSSSVFQSPTLSSVTSISQSVSAYNVPKGRSDHGYAKDSSSKPQTASSAAMLGGGDAGLVPTNATSSNIPVTQTLQSSLDPTMFESGDERSPGGRKAQKRRRISLVTEEIMMYGKRRSTRVRNTGRKKTEETVNFQDLLFEYLPSTLKTVQEDDAAMETDQAEPGADATSKVNALDSQAATNQEPAKLASQQWGDEVGGVKDFLQTSQKNAGLIYLMGAFLHEIAKRCKLKWPEGLADVFIKVFERARKHLYMPCVFGSSDSNEDFQELSQVFERGRKHLYMPCVFGSSDSTEDFHQLSQICLVWEELMLDRWLAARTKMAAESPALSPRGPFISTLPDEDVPAFFDQDLLFLTVLCSNSDRMGDMWIEHCIRVYWMQARYLVLRGKIEEALGCFERTKEYLEYGKEEMDVQQVFFPNCKLDNTINLGVVGSQHEQLQRNQSVAEIQHLYKERQFEKVVEILLQTFPQTKSKGMRVSDPTERQSQLILLQEALSETKDYKKCVLWGEESFHEAYEAYQATTNCEEKAEWVRTMVRVFTNMQSVMESHPEAISALPSAKLVRLSQNLTQAININMSLPESTPNMLLDTLLPWILLYLLMKHEESKLDASRDGEEDQEDKDEMKDSMSMLINVAHDYLGSRCWCVRSDGALLLFMMKELKSELDKEEESPCEEELQQAFEQCVYCLYGHPNKRTKAKHLQEHNVSAITLEWEQAIDLFDYFKPKSVPEFDGYQSEKISAEMEVLLKRIILLVPERSKSMGAPLEEIQSYIEGSNKTAPAIPAGREVTLPVINEIYYLLADYYLKNSEPLKAIKFYIQDLCMSPARLDSWAGMALARMSQLESRLTSTELKMDTPIYKKSIAALRCFKRAVEIDENNVKLWIEYGTLAYQLHSHACRQLKWKKWFAMDSEMVQIARESQREMLQTALDCYRMASAASDRDEEEDVSEEEWLLLYMQGKCLGKMGSSLTEVIPYYFKALESLHEDNAKYPKKIVYAYTTPHLAVESLEMYYRIHAEILKLLLKNQPDSDKINYPTIIGYINDAANLPFVKRIEKGNEGKLERESASSADESSSSAFDSPAVKKDGQNSKSDHTYFREKSLQGTPSHGLQDNQSQEKKMDVSSAAESPNKTPSSSFSMVKTLELHSEDQRSRDDVTLTTTECPKLTPQKQPPGEATVTEKPGEPTVTDKPGETTVNESQSDVTSKDSHSEKTFSSVNTLGNLPSGNDDAIKTEVDGKTGNTENEVKNVLNHISDLIEKGISEEKKSAESEDDSSRPVVKQDESTVEGGEAMDVDPDKHDGGDSQKEQKDGSGSSSSDKEKSSPDGEGKTKSSPDGAHVQDTVEDLMKLPRQELHRYLMDRCRRALEICMQRFPSNYKASYRLAHLYLHSPYHKDLGKAHDIMLGISKWQHHAHMPCQGLFWERKPTKFFQGIWKFPIDEIDRAGSFPAHLNRCIELTLKILREENDSQTLHQVHLQLNRQPEPGKKYLRDAEKKYYALMSHRYTLDAIEGETDAMRRMVNVDARLKFLAGVYRVWEHGVHKLNKQVERTNKLLAEAYRVVLRKLETLPQRMLLDQAIRFSKQLAQKSSNRPDGRSQDSRSLGGDSQMSNSKGTDPTSDTLQSSTAANVPKSISLANIMKSQTNYSMQKANQTSGQSQSHSIPGLTTSTNPAVADLSKADGKLAQKDIGDTGVDISDVIVLSDSSNVESPLKPKLGDEEGKQEQGQAPKKKIKMGLLQAVKRLKPTEGGKGDSDKGTGEESESEAPVPTASEDDADGEDSDSSSSSSSSTSSSSSSSSSSDEDDDDDDEEDDDDENADDEDESGESNSDEDQSQTSRKSQAKNKPASPIIKKTPIKLKAKPKPIELMEESEESSDGSDEIDLVSSDAGAKDDDKDEDYKASEDEEFDDVILVREEFSTKGRAVIPSPPHKHSFTEVLVESVPDIDPLISSMMAENVPESTAGKQKHRFGPPQPQSGSRPPFSVRQPQSGTQPPFGVRQPQSGTQPPFGVRQPQSGTQPPFGVRQPHSRPQQPQSSAPRPSGPVPIGPPIPVRRTSGPKPSAMEVDSD